MGTTESRVLDATKRCCERWGIEKVTIDDIAAGNYAAVTARFEAGGRSFEDLLVAIVQSDPFRMRRGEPSTEASP